MQRRIFIAINLPEEIKDELSQFQKKYSSLPCRWVKRDNLHLTLVFLGYIREEKLIEILKISEEIAKKNNPFSIFLNKICYGPETQFPPRLVWVKGERSEELIKLKKGFEELLSGKVPFIREKRELLPHITLARIKKWEWKRVGPDRKQKIDIDVSFVFPVNSIEVMESHLKRTGAEYKILESCSLKLET